ncbi:MAG TPA: ABC transporter permease [Chthoniobacteraceae bacterium]|jgi:lipopolysaccharide transport system permease protein|nr:ABC transporter permease [Chthoniobacteraceae bacterium]
MTAPPVSGDAPKFDLVIVAGRAARQYWRDLWRHRELLYFLTWRDVLVRYKQTVLGVAWAVIRPLVTIVIFTIIFGNIAHLPSEGVPYPVFVFAAMLPWQFLAAALSEASNSLTGNANLVSKVYFPRLIVPTSSVIVCFVDFLITAALLVVVLAWYGVAPTWHLLWLPLVVLHTVAAALGGGLWLAALNVNFRDFRYLVPFLVQIGMYVSPVGFSSTVVPDQWRMLYALNPVVGIVDSFRWAICGGVTQLHTPSLVFSWLLTLVLLTSGIWFFRRTERTFADTI